MRRAVLAGAFFCFCVLSSSLQAQAVPATPSKPFETIPVSQIHAGMRGVAYTVFQGTKPEPMDVEVLGIMKNANGPKGDLILVRLGGTKAEYTGVVAGMSGSPVYLDGKLAGALSFRIGEFSKEPIAGVTPIAEMLEINALDSTPAPAPIEAKAAANVPSKTSGPGISNLPTQDFANYLRPIEAPLVFSGFSQDAIERFAPQFASAGIVPVMGAGSVSDDKATRTPGARFGRECDFSARRHGYCCHLHRHLYGCPSFAGLRASSAAIRHGGSADDQGRSPGNAGFSTQCVQDH